MAIRKIRHEGDPVLKKRSKEVQEVTDRIRVLAEDMIDTMYENLVVGLAAPQVGILKRVIVVDVDMEESDPHIFINPVITDQEGEQRGPEGCLSVPGVRGDITRPFKIKVEYLDENGDERTMEAEDFFARAICHEIDHLDGILFVDREDFEISYDDEEPDSEEEAMEEEAEL